MLRALPGAAASFEPSVLRASSRGAGAFRERLAFRRDSGPTPPIRSSVSEKTGSRPRGDAAARIVRGGLARRAGVFLLDRSRLNTSKLKMYSLRRRGEIRPRNAGRVVRLRRRRRRGGPPRVRRHGEHPLGGPRVASRRGYSLETSRGDAATATWAICGDEWRRRRDRDVDIQCRRLRYFSSKDLLETWESASGKPREAALDKIAMMNLSEMLRVLKSAAPTKPTLFLAAMSNLQAVGRG